MFLWHILIWTDLSSIKFFIPQINTFIMISVEMLTAIPFAKWTCFTYYFNLPCKQRGNVEACEVSFSSFPFPLAGGGQSGVFDGFYPAVTFSSSLIHVLQKNTVACVSCVCTAVCSLFMAKEVVWWVMTGSQEAKYELCMEYRWSMGFPARACKDPTSGVAMKQSLRLVREVSLSISWNMESVPGKSRKNMGESNTIEFH